jgi:hypothetical protein
LIFAGGRERAEAAWAVAAHEIGEAPEALVSGRGRRRPPAPGYSVGETASRSRYPARLVALGRALATGLLSEDDTVLDHEQQTVDALAEIERPHLVLMQGCCRSSRSGTTTCRGCR